MKSRNRQTWAAKTVTGRVRPHNEDSVLAQPPLFVVADGLGGHEAGEVASSIAVETLRDHAPRHPDARALARAVKAANREVIRAAEEGVGRTGMGTTMTAAIVEGSRVAVAHVGDSRAYLLHGSLLQRISEDHSLVADLIRRGQLTEADARVHPQRSVITRALGSDKQMEADTYDVDASPGDRLLLCSDGLTSMLTDERIAEVLSAYRDPETVARALVDAANEAGGNDNISVIVVDIEGEAATGSRAGHGVARAMLAVVGWFVAAALVLGGVGYGVYRYAQTRYFVIAENGRAVAYRGVPGQIAGYSLSWRLFELDVPVDELPVGVQQRLVNGATVSSRAELTALIAEYEQLAPVDAEMP